MATACSLIQTLSTWHCSCQADMYRYTLLREIDVIGVCMERRRKRPSLAECLVFRNNSDSSTRLHRHPIAQCHPKKASSRKQHRNTNKKSNPKENTKKHQRPSNMQPLLHPSATVVGDFLVAIGSSEASFTERVGERQSRGSVLGVPSSSDEEQAESAWIVSRPWGRRTGCPACSFPCASA